MISFPIKACNTHTYIYTPIITGMYTVCGAPANAGIVSPRRQAVTEGEPHTFAHELEAQGCWDLIKVMSLCTWSWSSRLLGLDQKVISTAWGAGSSKAAGLIRSCC